LSITAHALTFHSADCAIDSAMNNRAPLIVVILLLLLPLVYLGCYLALVVPQGTMIVTTRVIRGNLIRTGAIESYLAGGRGAEVFFWPVEQIDRKLRPVMWKRFVIRTWNDDDTDLFIQEPSGQGG
jgi:hypothetical protein